MNRCNYCKQIKSILDSGRCDKCKNVGKPDLRPSTIERAAKRLEKDKK